MCIHYSLGTDVAYLKYHIHYTEQIAFEIESWISIYYYFLPTVKATTISEAPILTPEIAYPRLQRVLPVSPAMSMHWT